MNRPMIATVTLLSFGSVCAAHSVGQARSDGQAHPAEQARGVVFEDRNGNGVRDDGEPGLPDVAVSNGEQVVLTDADGAYRIPVEAEQILFVSQPRGYRAPVNAFQLPQFFYRHYPEGTPVELGLRYEGVEPTGPLPDSVDFPLLREEPADRFEVIWFADPQPQTPAEVDFVRDDVVTELIGSDAAFGVTLGDIMYDELSLFARQNAIIAEIGIPWYNVPGNHETNYLSPDDRHSLETFKRHFGPNYYSFDYGDVHFVMLDDVHYLGRDAGKPEPTLRGRGNYEGRIGKTQLAWLAADLEQVPEDRMIVLAMHIPLVSHKSKSPARQVLDRDELFRVLEGRPNVMAVAGHMHTTEHHYLDRGGDGGNQPPMHLHVLTTVSGSWWSGPSDERGIPVTEQRDGTPNGYHVMAVNGGKLALRYKAAGKPDDFQMRISLDSTFHQFGMDGLLRYRQGQLSRDAIAVDQLHSTTVVVNLFDGGPRSKLRMRIDDGPPIELTRTLRVDPFIDELFARNRDVVKSWVSAEESTHVWTGRLPADLAPGAHTLSVTAVDEYGQTHAGRKVLEVLQGASLATTPGVR
jgi:hypothetical protein